MNKYKYVNEKLYKPRCKETRRSNRYGESEACKVYEPFKELINKATPMKKCVIGGIGLFEHVCPLCSSKVTIYDNYCPHCGQRLE